MQKSEIESLQTELSDAKKAVRELTSRIEEANSRSKRLQRKPKWRQEEDLESSVTNEEARYEQVMKELERMKRELRELKTDMARVLKEKRRAERSSKASSSKTSTLLASMELMNKELQELDEKQAVIDFARIESVTECESVESDTNEFRLIVSNANALKPEESVTSVTTPVSMIEEELDYAKRELDSVKGERFKFMMSMDVIRDELKRVREETWRLQEEEKRQELTVQNLNSKILRAKAKLDSVTSVEAKTSEVISDLAITLEKLRREAETAKKDKEKFDEEIGNMNVEVGKTELEIEVVEDRLEAAIDELKGIKISESKALGRLRNLIYKTVEARDVACANSSTITITQFEYEYLTGKAGAAAVLADKKIAAAQAWVEALKASERELVLKTEMAEKEIGKLSIEVDRANAEGGLQGRVVGSARRSVGKGGKRVSVKLARLQKLQSPAAGRYSGKSGSVKREKRMPKLTKLFSKKNVAMDEGVI